MDKYLELFAELFAANGSIDLPHDEIDDKRAMLSVALFEGYLTTELGKSSNTYTLTENGKTLLNEYEMQQAAKGIVNTLKIFPMLFRNIHNGTVVLAIGETAGTVVKGATTAAYDEFAFPLGTFHTYFVPFYLNDVWQPIHEITIETKH